VRDKLQKQRMSPVRKEDGERMAKELGAVKYVECSALTQYKLKDVFDEVSLSFLPMPLFGSPTNHHHHHHQAIVAALEPPPQKKNKKNRCVIL